MWTSCDSQARRGLEAPGLSLTWEHLIPPLCYKEKNEEGEAFGERTFPKGDMQRDDWCQCRYCPLCDCGEHTSHPCLERDFAFRTIQKLKGPTEGPVLALAVAAAGRPPRALPTPWLCEAPASPSRLSL